MSSSHITTEKDFLFVIEIKNEDFYQKEGELRSFLKILPPSIRIYAIIHAGMSILKVYCITNSISDYGLVSGLTSSKTVIIDSKNMAENKATALN